MYASLVANIHKGKGCCCRITRCVQDARSPHSSVYKYLFSRLFVCFVWMKCMSLCTSTGMCIGMQQHQNQHQQQQHQPQHQQHFVDLLYRARRGSRSRLTPQGQLCSTSRSLGSTEEEGSFNSLYIFVYCGLDATLASVWFLCLLCHV